MTDEEVAELLPVVDEFIEAVEQQDAGFITAALGPANRAPLFAVVCARRLLDAEAKIADQAEGVREARAGWAAEQEANRRLRERVARLSNSVLELRHLMNHRAAAAPKTKARKAT